MKVPGEGSKASAVLTRSTPPVAVPPPQKIAPPPLLAQPVTAQKPAGLIPGYLCSVCGGLFPLDRVLDHEGVIVCFHCHAAAPVPQLPGEEAPGSFPMVPTLSTLMSQPAEPESLSESFSETSFPVDDPMPLEQEGATETHEIASDQIEGSADEPLQDDIVVGESGVEDDTVADLGSVAAPPSPRRRPAAKKTSVPALIIGGSIALIVAGVATYYITLHSGKSGTSANAPVPQDLAAGAPWTSSPATGGPDQIMSEWEKKNIPRLSQYRSTAKAMEVSNDLAGAQLMYQRMLTLARAPGATVQNSGVVAMLAEAQTSFDAISKKIGPPPPPVALLQPGAATNPSGVPEENGSPSPLPATVPSATSEPAVPLPAPSSEPAPQATVVDWEPAHHDQILQLASEADALEKKQQPVAALATEEKLLQLVGDHRPTLNDPQLKAAVATAEDSRKRLLDSARDSVEARVMTARSLLGAGLKAEQDKKWRTALELLTDSSRLISPMLRPVMRYRDPTYLATLNGMAVAYMNLKAYPRAGELFADDAPLGRGSLAMNLPARELIWNRAVNDLTQKLTIMRSVKMLQDYLGVHTEADEPMLNLMGTILFVADASNPPNRKVLDEAIGFYGQRSSDLEKTHPGQRRWGVQWLSEDDAKTQFDNYNKALDTVSEKTRARTAAETHLKDVTDASHRNNGPRATLADVNAAKAQVVAAAAAVKAAHDAIPSAPWLTDVQPIIPAVDLSAPLALAAGTSAGAGSPATAPSALSLPASTSQPSAAIAFPSSPEARFAAAFPIDRTHLITAADPLGTAASVMLEDTHGVMISARVVATAGRLGLLEVNPAEAGGPLNYLPLATDFTSGAAQCAAIPQANIFVPSVAMLTADAPAPQKSAWWIGLSDHPRLAGSPLLNAQNEVIGVEVASRDDAKQKIPSVTLEDLRKFLASNHVVPASSAAKPDATNVWQVTAESE